MKKIQAPDRQSRYYVIWEKQEKKRKKEKRIQITMKLLLVFLCVVFVVCIIGIILSLSAKRESNNLYGLWKYDTATGYYFDKGGKGILVVPNNEHPFLYSVDQNLLILDFEEKELPDMEFQFSVDKRMLILLNTVTGQEFSLQKSE